MTWTRIVAPCLAAHAAPAAPSATAAPGGQPRDVWDLAESSDLLAAVAAGSWPDA